MPKTLKWTRYLGYSSINPALNYLPYDPLNNCSQSLAYSLTCQLNLQLESLPKARHCQTQSKRIIDDCSLNTNAYICRLYRMTVSYNGRIYANPHCAECNGIQMNTTQCSSVDEVVLVHDHGLGKTIQNEKLSEDIIDLQQKPAVFNSLRGQMWTTDLDFMAAKKCQNEAYLQIWDPIGQTCYNLSCGFYSEARDGSCYYRNVTLRTLECNITREMNWWEFRYTKIKFTIITAVEMRKSILDLNDSIYINREFANGSIYHKKLEMVYDVDDYNLYHFEKLGGLERIYKVCLPYPKDTLVNTKIIRGMQLCLGGIFVKMHDDML